MGNLISDFVKGRRQFHFPDGIQKGIVLHRDIDRFTDEHAATREAKQVFRPAYRLYAGAFVDVVYDHFLAADTQEFTEESLAGFSQSVYKRLDPFTGHFPEKFSRMFPYMKEQDWLFHYRSLWGMEKSFGGLVRRALHLQESDTAFDLLQQHYRVLNDCYREFFPAVKEFARQRYEELIN